METPATVRMDGFLEQMQEFAPIKDVKLPDPVVQAPVAPVVIEKEFDILGEKVKFSGSTADEAYEKGMAELRRRYEEAQLLQRIEEKPDVVAPMPYFEPVAELNMDQLAALQIQYNRGEISPVEYNRIMMEQATGIRTEDLKEALPVAMELKHAMYEAAVGQQFVDTHPDYYACGENYNKILRFLEAKQKSITPESLEYAYSSLRNINALISAPAKTEPKQQDLAPTALSGSVSSVPVGQGQDVESLRQQMATMDMAKLREAVDVSGRLF